MEDRQEYQIDIGIIPMRIALILALLCLSGSARADTAAEADQVLTTLARWGLCVVDRMGETEAKSMMYATVAKVDMNFQRRYGRRATEFAQDAYGENFVQHYYEAAKAAHDPRAATCQALSLKVIALAQ